MTEEQLEYIEAMPFPTTFSCADIIMVREKSIAMITKTEGGLLHLPGGFIDPTDLCNKAGAMRESREEIGIRGSMWKDLNVNILCSDRGRYNPDTSKHRLRTNLFEASSFMEEIEAGDDALTAKWIPYKNFRDMDWVLKNVAPGHVGLIFYWLGKNGKFEG